MAYEFGDGIKTILLLGIGAAATTAEKTAEILGDLVKKGELTVEQSSEILDDLVKKGKITVEQGKAFNQELQRSVKESMDRAAAAAEQASSAETEDAFPTEGPQEAEAAAEPAQEEAEAEEINEDRKDFASYVAGLSAEELEALKEEIAKAQL